MTEEEVQIMQAELELARQQLRGLEADKAAYRDELAARDTAVSELRQQVAARDSELAVQQQAAAEFEDRFEKISSDLSQAVASYRALVVRSNPDVPEDMVSGDTIEAIDGAIKSARELINRVRENMEEEMSLAKFPIGAPVRTAPDFSALSPREKIQYAIGGKR